MYQILVSFLVCHFEIVPVDLLRTVSRTDFNTITWDFEKMGIISVFIQKKAAKRLVPKSNESFPQKLNLIIFSVLLGHLDNTLINFVYFLPDILLVSPLPFTWLYLLVYFFYVLLRHYGSQFIEIFVDVEIITQSDTLYEIFHGFTFDLITFVHNETKKLTLDNRDILLGIYFYFLTSAILHLSFLDDLWDLVEPIIDFLHDLIFYQFFIIPVLRSYLLIFTHLLWQGYIFQKDGIILLTDLRTVIKPTIIFLHIAPKIQEEYDGHNRKYCTQIVHHH